jgi:hypothetical protein
MLVLDRPTGTTQTNFGNFFKRQDQQATFFQTNSSNWSRVLEMNTDFVNDGMYRLNISFDHFPQCSQSNSFSVRAIVNDSNTVWSRNVTSFRSFGLSNAVSTFVDVPLTNNVHNIRIEARTFNSNDSVIIQNGMIDFWNLS